MPRISLVVSDVDGTLLPKDKVLTEGNKHAVRKLHEAGIGFTIVSSRPTIGMGFLIEPLAISLPIGAFNGSSIVDAKLKPIEQHLIAPDVAQRSLDVLDAFGVDIWLFTNDRWLTRNPDGEYVPHEKRAIRESGRSRLAMEAGNTEAIPESAILQIVSRVPSIVSAPFDERIK